MSAHDDRQYPRPYVWPPFSDEDYRQEAVVRVGERVADEMARIRLLVFDADGVMTGGDLIYGAGGEIAKVFHSHDGLGLVMARNAGLKLGVVTGRHSEIVARRCSELRFDAIKLGRFDKVDALGEILLETGSLAAETMYLGDDLIDLPALHQVGVPASVPDAPQEVRDAALYVTRRRGGAGAIREVVDLVLKSAGLYGLALRRLVEKSWQPTRQQSSTAGDPGRDEGQPS